MVVGVVGEMVHEIGGPSAMALSLCCTSCHVLRSRVRNVARLAISAAAPANRSKACSLFSRSPGT